MWGLSGIHGSDGVALYDGTSHRPAYAFTVLGTVSLGFFFPPVEKLALGTLADLAMPFCIALEIGPDTGTGPNGNLEQTRIGKHMRD